VQTQALIDSLRQQLHEQLQQLQRRAQRNWQVRADADGNRKPCVITAYAHAR